MSCELLLRQNWVLSGSGAIKKSMHLICLVLISGVLFLTGTSMAYAVSSGCVAVRGGALNTAINDVFFNGDFEKGETLIFTLIGGTQEATVTPPGGLLTVAGNTATFTFTMTGNFQIDLTGGSAVTTTCEETTVEKQAAVKAAVKTLTEMQLAQSLAFQGHLLTELTNSFLNRSTTSGLTQETERVIFTLEARRQRLAENIAAERQRLAQQIATQQGFIKQFFQSDVDKFNQQVAQRNTALNYLASIVSGPKFIPSKENRDYQQYLLAKRKERAQQPAIDEARRIHGLRYGEQTQAISALNAANKRGASRAELGPLEQAVIDAKGRVFAAQQAFNFTLEKQSTYMSAVDRYYPRYGIVLRNKAQADRTVASANTQIAALQGAHDAAQQGIAAKNTYIAGLQSQTNARIAAMQAEDNALSAEIGRIRTRIGDLGAQGALVPTPFAGGISGGAGLSSLIGASAYGPGGGSRRGAKSDGVGSASFFADLNKLRRARQNNHGVAEDDLAKIEGLAAYLNTQNSQPGAAQPKYNVWSKGDFSDSESDQVGADRKSQSYSFATGAYYAPDSKFMIGGMYRYRSATSKSVAQDSDVSTKGHGVGVHSTLVLTSTLSVSAQALYERSNNNIDRAGATGSYASDQISTSGTLQGSYSYQGWWLRPAVGISYAHVDTDAFIDSTGTRISGQITEQGQMTFGPSIGTRILAKDSWGDDPWVKYFDPSFSVTGIWSFMDEGDTTLASGTIIEQDDVSAQVNGALSMLLHDNSTLSVNAGYAGFGDSQVETFSFGGKYSIPLGM